MFYLSYAIKVGLFIKFLVLSSEKGKIMNIINFDKIYIYLVFTPE